MLLVTIYILYLCRNQIKMSRYQLSEEAIDRVKQVLNNLQEPKEILKMESVFTIKSRQIRNVLKSNYPNGIQTSIGVVEHIKNTTGMPESKILKEVK